MQSAHTINAPYFIMKGVLVMNQEHLAIASVPIQEWTTVVNQEEALLIGTIFPELDKPFYCGEKSVGGKKTLTPQENMMLEIQQVSFVIDDLRLFLDTHPDNMNGLELMKSMLKKRKELLKNFALQFYPLTMDCMADIYENYPNSECYCWQQGPIPWEGAKV